ncbi:MAG TPA: FISUMP domain-containing protein, partial [Bacteroidales bacterium]|nr:FISUMP domain-containing protein [Bacteroidales bacterium]
SATFTWTVVSSSPNLSGQSDGSGPLIAQTITNTGNTIEHLTYTVTPEAWSCPPGPSRTVVLTVNPRPIVNNSTTTFQICSAGSTNIIPTSSVPGSTFAWTASGSSADVTGFSDGAGPSIVQSLTNTGYNIEAVTYQVTATANSCPGNATPFVVTVFPVANVVFTPNGQTFCSGQTATINLSSHVAGTSYTWTATGSGASLSGYSDGSGDLIQQTLTNSGPYPQTATYLVAPTANACPGTNNSVVVTVNPYPAVTFSLCKDPVVSFNAQPITLKGALPLGGTYSGAGVASGIFDPSSAGTGTHMITYNYVNSWLCSSSASDSITVVAIPAFNCGNPLTDVRDGQSYSTVKIGTQCWFADNLNYGNTLRSGLLQRDNCIPEKYCFNDNIVNCTSLGGMYQWDELMKYEAKDGAQGLCPPEWHVPTETDWTNLFNFYVSNGFAGSPLKNTGYSGFDAFLLGTRFNNVQWDFSTFAVMFWSSTSHGPKKAWAHGMNEFNPSVSYYPSHRNNAFFTRCIKD